MKSESSRESVGQGGTEPLTGAWGDTGCGQRLGEGSWHRVCVYIGPCMAALSLHTLSSGEGLLCGGLPGFGGSPWLCSPRGHRLHGYPGAEGGTGPGSSAGAMGPSGLLKASMKSLSL